MPIAAIDPMFNSVRCHLSDISPFEVRVPFSSVKPPLHFSKNRALNLKPFGSVAILYNPQLFRNQS
jgi:hypothetical protein